MRVELSVPVEPAPAALVRLVARQVRLAASRQVYRVIRFCRVKSVSEHAGLFSARVVQKSVASLAPTFCGAEATADRHRTFNPVW